MESSDGALASSMSTYLPNPSTMYAHTLPKRRVSTVPCSRRPRVTAACSSPTRRDQSSRVSPPPSSSPSASMERSRASWTAISMLDGTTYPSAGESSPGVKPDQMSPRAAAHARAAPLPRELRERLRDAGHAGVLVHGEGLVLLLDSHQREQPAHHAPPVRVERGAAHALGARRPRPDLARELEVGADRVELELRAWVPARLAKGDVGPRLAGAGAEGLPAVVGVYGDGKAQRVRAQQGGGELERRAVSRV
mmetsp:Transcript_36484/g.118660  ORF Transcript_36484/g.118660 Transcript_36484/m.118660 type:complete len:251 (+) Transcript_36484:878-1630(+)